MNEYVYQKHKYDCGPTAIFNALVYYGLNPRLSFLRRLSKICCCDKYNGTLAIYLALVLDKYFDAEYYFSGKKSVRKKLVKHLLNKKPAIITHGGHSFLIDEYSPKNKKIYTINLFASDYCKVRTPIHIGVLDIGLTSAFLINDVKSLRWRPKYNNYLVVKNGTK